MKRLTPVRHANLVVQVLSKGSMNQLEAEADLPGKGIPTSRPFSNWNRMNFAAVLSRPLPSFCTFMYVQRSPPRKLR